MAKKTITKKPHRKRAKTSAKKTNRRTKHEANGRHSARAATETLEQIELPIELPPEMIEVVVEETIEFPAVELDSEPAATEAPTARRLLPLGEELKNLYARYSAGSTFDDHDKAFYFVLNVGGVSRARQLIDHVEEVLEELEEFRA